MSHTHESDAVSFFVRSLAMAQEEGLTLEELLKRAQEVGPEVADDAQDGNVETPNTGTHEVPEEDKNMTSKYGVTKTEFPGYIRDRKQQQFSRGTKVQFDAKNRPFVLKSNGLREYVAKDVVSQTGKLKKNVTTEIQSQVRVRDGKVKNEKTYQRRIWAHLANTCTCVAKTDKSPEFHCIAVREIPEVDLDAYAKKFRRDFPDHFAK